MSLARLVAVLLLVVACGGPSPTPQRTTVTSPAPLATPKPATPVPGATPEPTATRQVTGQSLPAPVAELEPGTYSKEDFEPAITFTVGEGWSAVQSTAGFFDIQDKPGDLHVVAVQFGNVTEQGNAQAVATAVSERDYIVLVGPIQPAAVSGYSGLEMTVETVDDAQTDPPVFRPVIRLTPGDVSIASGRRLELTLLDVHGGVLAIMVGGSMAEWDHALEIAAPVIESVQIGD